MKRLFFQTIIVFSAIVLAGCRESGDNQDNKPGMPPPSYHYFIKGYVIPSEMNVHFDEDLDCLVWEIIGETVEVADTPEELSEEARYFVEMYNDTYKGHNRVTALAYPIDEVTIFCDKDFDARHSAREVLDDIVRTQYTSYYPYILNGYHLIYNPSLDIKWWAVSYDLCLDCVRGDLATLISCSTEGKSWGRLTFTTTPDTPGEYTFTLSLTTNGETYTTTFTHTFE